MNVQPKVPLPEYASTYLVDVGDSQVAVLDYAPSGYQQTVHMVHGFTGSKEDFSQIAPFIAAAGYRVIAHDHRGCHQSSHAPSTYSLAQLAADVLAVQAAVGVTSPHLLGHSFGGLVARAAALDQQPAPASLTLFCTGPARPVGATGWLLEMQEFLREKSMVEAWDYMDAHPDHSINFRTDGDPNSLVSSRWRASDNAAIVAQADMIVAIDDRTNELAASALPIHVVYGEFDDAWPLAEQDRVAEATDAPVSVIKDAGHCPNEERPAETAAALIKFWDSLR